MWVEPNVDKDFKDLTIYIHHGVNYSILILEIILVLLVGYKF